MMRRATWAATLVGILVVAASGYAQETRTIAPGMTEDEVTAEFGEPIYTRSRGDFTFYFYDNRNEEEYGFLDLVIFESGQVVDAVLRAPWHQYTGESSSPRGVVPRPTPGGERLVVPQGEVEGVEVRPAPDTASSSPDRSEGSRR